MGRESVAKAAPYPFPPRIKFGGGRVGEAKRAADIKVGIAGCKGAFTAFAPDAEIPTFFARAH